MKFTYNNVEYKPFTVEKLETFDDWLKLFGIVVAGMAFGTIIVMLVRG